MSIFRTGIFVLFFFSFYGQSFGQVNEIKKTAKKDKKSREKKKEKNSGEGSSNNNEVTYDQGTKCEETETEKRNWFFRSNKTEEPSESSKAYKFHAAVTPQSHDKTDAYNPLTDPNRSQNDSSKLMLNERFFPSRSNFAEFGYNVGWGNKYKAKMDMMNMAFGWRGVSSELRFQNITDDTGVLGLFDWQILKMNFYSENLRFAIGGGFVSIIDMSLTYFEWSMLFEAYMIDKLMKLSLEYRDATRIDAPSFRREISAFVDYDLTPKWKTHFSPMAGLRYQNYFGDFNQLFFEVGMIVRIH